MRIAMGLKRLVPCTDTKDDNFKTNQLERVITKPANLLL